MIAGELILLIMLPREQSTHIVICEYGLLQTKKTLRRYSCEAVLWKDIPPVRNDLLDYNYPIYYGEGKKLTLSSAYQDRDDLIAQIVRHSEEKKWTEPLIRAHEAEWSDQK